MTLFGVEKAMYDLGGDRRARELFAAEPERLLSRYGLDPDEHEALRSFNVNALHRAGANPMLVWGFWMTCSGRSTGAYLNQLRDHESTRLQKGEQ